MRRDRGEVGARPGVPKHCRLSLLAGTLWHDAPRRALPAARRQQGGASARGAMAVKTVLVEGRDVGCNDMSR